MANYMNTLTAEDKRAHTIPGRRAIQYRAAERRISGMVDGKCLLTPDQLDRLALILLKASAGRTER